MCQRVLTHRVKEWLETSQIIPTTSLLNLIWIRTLNYSVSSYLNGVPHSSHRAPLFHNFKNLKMHKNLIRSKSKAILLQAWTGPEDSRTFPDFKTIGT